MTCHLPIFTVCLMIAGLSGCSQLSRDDLQGEAPVRQLDEATINVGLDPRDARIVAFVAWLKQKGVTLEYVENAEDNGGNWRFIKPQTSDDYLVAFSIRSLPPWASSEQMREALDINLKYMLNASEHLAMSHAMTSGTHPDAQLPKTDDELPKFHGVPVSKVVEELFGQYVTHRQ